MTRATPDWGALQSAIAGDVVLPGSSDYESVRKPAIALLQDVRPQAVVLCRTPTDVSETISFAIRYGLPTATRSGGHCFAGNSSTHGIVIDVTPMRSVSVSGGVATVGAGADLGEVYLGMIDQGLTIPGGTCPSVGIAGLTLGGGLGMLGRKHGVTSDHLLGARIVLADGRIIECDDHHDEELFWALRGAGTGHFGVVSDLVFRPIPAPAMTIFHLTWSFSHAAAVAQAWQGWAPTPPDEEPSVEMFGAVLGNRTDAAELLGEVVARTKADPDRAQIEEMSYLDALRHWADRAGERLEAPPEHASPRSF